MRAVASEGQQEGPVPLLGFQAAQRSTVTRAQTGAFEDGPVDCAEAAVWSSAVSPWQLPAHVHVSVSGSYFVGTPLSFGCTGFPSSSEQCHNVILFIVHLDGHGLSSVIKQRYAEHVRDSSRFHSRLFTQLRSREGRAAGRVGGRLRCPVRVTAFSRKNIRGEIQTSYVHTHISVNPGAVWTSALTLFLLYLFNLNPGNHGKREEM